MEAERIAPTVAGAVYVPWLNQASWPVLYGFGDMVRFDDISTLQVCQGAAYLQDAVEGTGGKIELLHGRLEQALGRFLG